MDKEEKEKHTDACNGGCRIGWTGTGAESDRGRVKTMKEIMDEYGSMFLAVTGLILFLGTMSSVMLSQSGVLMKMVQVCNVFEFFQCNFMIIL